MSAHCLYFTLLIFFLLPFFLAMFLNYCTIDHSNNSNKNKSNFKYCVLLLSYVLRVLDLPLFELSTKNSSIHQHTT